MFKKLILEDKFRGCETCKQKAGGPPCGIYWHAQQVTESLKINSPI